VIRSDLLYTSRELTLERRRIWSGFHSHSRSSALDEFQLSELFLFGSWGTRIEFAGDPQLRGVRGEAAVLIERREEERREIAGWGRRRACIDNSR
jgi:hypothetical protein